MLCSIYNIYLNITYFMNQEDKDLLKLLFGYQWKNIGKKPNKTIWDPKNELSNNQCWDGKDYDYSIKPHWSLLWNKNEERFTKF